MVENHRGRTFTICAIY